MNTRRFLNPMSATFALTVFALLIVVGITLAQQPTPGTEPGAIAPTTAQSTSSSAQADGGVLPHRQIPSSRAATDGGAAEAQQSQPPANLAADENAPNADGRSPQNTQAVFSYYYASGSTLQPRDGGTNRDYSSTGCSYVTAGSDLILNTELHIPDGSIIKYLRIYYNDTSGAANVQGYITRYNTGTSTNDLVSAISSGSGGVGTALSPEITHTVDNFGYAYVLIGWPGAIGTQVQICGLRVAYYAPAFSASFLPTVRRP